MFGRFVGVASWLVDDGESSLRALKLVAFYSINYIS